MVESLIATIRRELWDVEHFEDLSVASTRLTQFLDDYNERRAHMGLDGLTPADRYHRRTPRVLLLLDAVGRRRQGAPSQRGSHEQFEGIPSSHSGAPMEVLRLVIVDGQIQLRLCGARGGVLALPASSGGRSRSEGLAPRSAGLGDRRQGADAPVQALPAIFGTRQTAPEGHDRDRA
ncbi:MAG: transposase [Myxococcales bacterium]|nr:transposase [Myxococcales bacterium]